MAVFLGDDDKMWELPAEVVAQPNLLVARHCVDGLVLDLHVEARLGEAVAWLQSWFRKYEPRVPSLEITFLILSFDSSFSNDNLGRVEPGSSARSLTCGTFPSGPSDGIEVPASEFLKLLLMSM